MAYPLPRPRLNRRRVLAVAKIVNPGAEAEGEAEADEASVMAIAFTTGYRARLTAPPHPR